MRYTHVFLGLTVLFSACVWALSICGKCGFEITGNAGTCSNCGAAAARGAGEGSDGDKGDVDSDDSGTTGQSLQSISAQHRAALVKEELSASQKLMNMNRYGMAFLYARNTKALATAVGAPAEYDRAAARVMTACISSGSIRRMPCETCGGNGKRKIVREGLTPGDTRTFEGGGRCTSCNGTGKTSGKRQIGAWKKQLARDHVLYVRHRQKEGFVPEGRAWIPKAWADALSLEDRTALRRLIPPDCGDCEGVGQTECSTCKARGEVKCRADRCRDGQVHTTRDGLNDSQVTVKRNCRVCGANGYVFCGACGGNGLETCEDCRGTGIPPVCGDCQGTGVGECRSCRGSGMRKDEPCESCSGHGRNFCKKCEGFGHDS